MAISYVGESLNVAYDSNGGYLSCSKPAGVIPGDLMIAFVTNWNRMPIPPSGWTRFRYEIDAGGLIHLSGWYKIAGTSEPSSYSFNGGAQGPVTWGIGIMAYRGAHPTDPIAAHESYTNQNSQFIFTDEIIITEDNLWLAYAFGMRNNNNFARTLNSHSGVGHIERAEDQAFDASGAFSRAMAMLDSNGVTIAQGDPEYTGTWSVTNTSNCAVIVAIRPAPEEGDENAPGNLIESPPFEQVSQKFRDALYKSHTVFSYVDVKGPNGISRRLEVTDGSVEVDKTAETRRRCTLTCVDPTGELTPRDVGDLLTPFGTEIKPFRGMMYSATPGDHEVVPLGVFRISKVDISDDEDALTLGIEASDLSRTISRNKFIEPYTVEVGTNIIDAIKALCKRTFPEQAFNFVGTARTVESTRVYDIGDDPWEAMTELSTSLGYDLYFDVWGQLCILPFPNIENLPSPMFRYIEGENCTMLSLTKVLSDSPGYNGVVVLGEAPSDDAPAVMGIAWDEEPTSATYYKGPYGAVPMFHQDQLVKTEQEAADTAAALLKSQLGFSSGLEISALPNPLFECGNVVEVRREKSHVDDVFVIDAFNVPLRAAGTQELTLRQKRQ